MKKSEKVKSIENCDPLRDYLIFKFAEYYKTDIQEKLKILNTKGGNVKGITAFEGINECTSCKNVNKCDKKGYCVGYKKR